jgi:AraC-like DNA-binding protein
MHFVQRRPSAPLDRHVDGVWFCRNTPGPRRLERVLPSGAPQLVVNLLEDQTRVYRLSPRGLACDTGPGAVLTGITTRYQLIDSDETALVAGVAFRPGGTLPFFAVPASQLRDRDVALDDLWGWRATGRLREQLLAAATDDAVLDALEGALRAAWRETDVHRAVAHALRAVGRDPALARMTRVADAAGLSQRRLAEHFKHAVGVTPKRYCRLLRFQQVVRTAHPARALDWTTVAAACGYFDQAHLIHEFREFSGMTPSAYAAGRTVHHNHVDFLQAPPG